MADVDANTARVTVDDGLGGVRQYRVAAKSRTAETYGDVTAPNVSVDEALYYAFGKDTESVLHVPGASDVVTLGAGWTIGAHGRDDARAIYTDAKANGLLPARLCAGDSLYLKAPRPSTVDTQTTYYQESPRVAWACFDATQSTLRAFAQDHTKVEGMEFRGSPEATTGSVMTWDLSAGYWSYKLPGGYVSTGEECVVVTAKGYYSGDGMWTDAATESVRPVPITIEATEAASVQSTAAGGASVAPTHLPPTRWMKYLSDDTPINRMSIPGTHDTVTHNLWHNTWRQNFDLWVIAMGKTGGAAALAVPWSVAGLKEYSVTQSMDIKGQLKAGVRFLDIRLEADKHGKLHTVHSLVPLHYGFDRVLDDCDKFLTEAPQ